MLIKTLQLLFARDLQRLKNEIASYQNEQQLWYVEKGIANSGGNLCLHLIGNLNTYIGRGLGNIEYVRNREQEFSLKGVPKSELTARIEDTIQRVEKALAGLTETALQNDYPELVWEEKTSIEYLLVHLAGHLTYHLGQINYHRRLLDHP